MFDTGFLANWQAELKEMNKGKERATYRYPNSLILLLATTVHVYLLLPYRQLRISEGDVSAYTGAKRSTGLHYNVVEESSKNKDTKGTEFRGKSGKSRGPYNNTS